MFVIYVDQMIDKMCLIALDINNKTLVHERKSYSSISYQMDKRNIKF